MGLLDVLNGMQHGPRGASPSAPTTQSKESGGMSPMMMALLGLLAYKAFKGLTGGGKPAAKAPAPAPAPAPPPARAPGGTVAAGMPGNLNDLLKGGLGGLLAGGAAGTVLSGGLNDLLKQLQDGGHGEIGKVLGRHRAEPSDFAEGPRLGARRRPDQLADLGVRPLARRVPRRAEQILAAGRRSPDPRWPGARGA